MAADHEKIARAEEASRIYNSRMFSEAWDQLRETLKEKILSTAHDETDVRELHYHRIKLLDELKSALIKIMNEGSIEAKSLKLRRVK